MAAHVRQRRRARDTGRPGCFHSSHGPGLLRRACKSPGDPRQCLARPALPVKSRSSARYLAVTFERSAWASARPADSAELDATAMPAPREQGDRRRGSAATAVTATGAGEEDATATRAGTARQACPCRDAPLDTLPAGAKIGALEHRAPCWRAATALPRRLLGKQPRFLPLFRSPALAGVFRCLSDPLRSVES